jgi:transcriptional regulator with XRE-family HTH domain
MPRSARRHSSRVFDGEGLAIAREGQFWTQGELATKVGVTVRQVLRWEKGESQPHFKQVRALAELFEVPPESLYVKPEANDDPLAVAS